MRILTYISLLFSTLLFSQESLNLSLEEAIERVKTENIAKKNALLEVEIAKQVVKETKASGLPQLNGAIDYTNNLKQAVQPFGSQLVTFGTKQNASGSLTLNQLLFDGSFLVGLQTSKSFQKISELALLKTDESLTEAVLTAYSSAIIAEENLKILEKNLQVINKNLHDVTEIYKVGLGEEQTVDQMQYNKNAIAFSIENLKNSQKIINQNLKYILNIDEETTLNLTTTFDDILNQNITLVKEDNTIDFANHIDVQILNNQKTTDALQVKYEKAKYLPSVSAFLTTAYNAFSDKFEFFDTPYYNSTVFGVGMDIPIFSGFSKRSRVQQAKYKLQQTQLKQEDLQKELQKNANEKSLSYKNAITQYELAEQQIALSEKIYTKEEIKFYEGLGSSNDLTQAENQKYQAQSQYIQAVNEVILQKIALDKALGNYNLN